MNKELVFNLDQLVWSRICFGDRVSKKYSYVQSIPLKKRFFLEDRPFKPGYFIDNQSFNEREVLVEEVELTCCIDFNTMEIRTKPSVKMMYRDDIFHQEFFNTREQALEFYNYIKRNTENKIECK